MSLMKVVVGIKAPEHLSAIKLPLSPASSFSEVLNRRNQLAQGFRPARKSSSKRALRGLHLRIVSPLQPGGCRLRWAPRLSGCPALFFGGFSESPWKEGGASSGPGDLNVTSLSDP